MQDVNTPTHQIGVTMKKHRLYGLYGLLVLLNAVLFSYTYPLESPAVVVIAGFLLVSLDIVVVTQLIVRFLCLFFPKLERYRRRLTVALASFAIIAIALASLGQLTWRDIIVVVIIGLIGYMYSLRFRIGIK